MRSVGSAGRRPRRVIEIGRSVVAHILEIRWWFVAEIGRRLVAVKRFAAWLAAEEDLDTDGVLAVRPPKLINGLFDEDGNWKSEDQRVKLKWDQRVSCGWNQRNINFVEAHKPTFFSDLVNKVDIQGAPDYAHGWWDEDDEDE